MRLTAFFKLYKICILLHRCSLKIFAKNRFEKTAIFVKIQQKKLQMSQNSQNFAKFQKFQLENLVDLEKCCKTHIYLQKSVPIQPKTSNILPNFAKHWQLPYGSERGLGRVPRAPHPRHPDRGRGPSGAACANFFGGAVWGNFRENANCGDPRG